MARGRSAETTLQHAGIDALAREMGYRLGLSIGSALAQTAARGVEQGRSAVRESSGTAACGVPGCTRAAVAKGLCATHYRKAHRTGLKAPFDGRALAALAADGRKLRSGG